MTTRTSLTRTRNTAESNLASKQSYKTSSLTRDQLWQRHSVRSDTVKSRLTGRFSIFDGMSSPHTPYPPQDAFRMRSKHRKCHFCAHRHLLVFIKMRLVCGLCFSGSYTYFVSKRKKKSNTQKWRGGGGGGGGENKQVVIYITC